MTETLLPRDHARRVLNEEADALRLIAERLDDAFDDACERLYRCAGRVVVTGMGKSGSVGRKIVGTLASLGTPALFLHPAEALHGDLGMVTGNDVVLALSYSGETDELRAILPALRRRAAALIAMTGNPLSTLAESSDIVLNVAVPREACALELAPTTSTTAMIALGDALAIAVMEARGFGKADYAALHPAGSLGRRLLLRVADVMRTGDQIAIVPESTPIQDALFAITRGGCGTRLRSQPCRKTRRRPQRWRYPPLSHSIGRRWPRPPCRRRHDPEPPHHHCRTPRCRSPGSFRA